MKSAILLCLIFAALLCPLSYGQSRRDMNKEAAIWNKLSGIAPDQVDRFKQATEKMDSGDYRGAIVLYQQVVNAAPNFDPALRRLGLCMSESGNPQTGVSLIETAVQINRSSENLSSLANVLAFPRTGTAPKASLERALELLHEATIAAEPDPSDFFVTAQIAGLLQNEPEFRQATTQMVQRFPNLAMTHYLNAIRAEGDGQWTEAENEIGRAEQLGFPPNAIRELRASLARARSGRWRYARYLVYPVLAWMFGLALLFISGRGLSRTTLRYIDHQGNTEATVTASEMRLRKIYRRLINVAGFYYYLSLPFVILLLSAVAVGVFLAFNEAGRIPIRLIAALAIGTAATIYIMIRSLFIKVKPEDPGRTLTREEAPALWKLTEEVAADLGTRPVQEIRITPLTELAVYERGTRKEKSQDKATRILILGIGALNGFRAHAFRAVLAHEYGHFTHRDTAGGDVAFRVNNDMMNFAMAMARSGYAVWWNIGFLFVRIYHFLFRRISHGASRLQEVLADRMAALKYGADAFEEGLRHVIRRSLEFPVGAKMEIAAATSGRRPLSNLYDVSVEIEPSAIDKEISRPTSEDDTHPSAADRFRLVRQVQGPSGMSDASMVWDFFQSRETVTKEFTDLIDQSIDRSGARAQ
jgi:Zn-dependent protease with chaperone function